MMSSLTSTSHDLISAWDPVCACMGMCAQVELRGLAVAEERMRKKKKKTWHQQNNLIVPLDECICSSFFLLYRLSSFPPYLPPSPPAVSFPPWARWLHQSKMMPQWLSAIRANEHTSVHTYKVAGMSLAYYWLFWETSFSVWKGGNHFYFHSFLFFFFLKLTAEEWTW